MAKNLKVRATVPTPRTRLHFPFCPSSLPSAITRTEIRGAKNRSFKLDVPSLPHPEEVVTEAVHGHAGIVTIRIGDDSTETTLLALLAESMLPYCRYSSMAVPHA
jgi:hypothetical protein